jgi:glycosyltransferase involved in cell wall biosynthesis
MKICWFGIYDKKYSRNDILLSGLRQNGVEVVECAADWKEPQRYRKLITKLKALSKDYDIVYAAYPAPIATIVAKLCSRKPVWMDAFYSMYDAVVNDRREVPWFHPRALKLALIDWLGVMAADHIVVDTEEHKKYWAGWPLVRASKIHVVYLGVNTELIHPLDPGADPMKGTAGRKFLVHFHGTYIPLQGVDKIVEAAAFLKDDSSIRFRLIGSGGNSKKTASFIAASGLKNVELIGRVPIDTLNVYMAEADAVLGIFGDTAKALRVIPNKVYEGMAAGKPVITMDSPAMREIFSGDDALLIKNDPRSIADAIRLLQRDRALGSRLALHARGLIMAKYAPKEIAASLISEMRGVR